MTEYSVHRPTYTGTKNDWEFPTEQDFDTDDLPAVAEQFLVSASGFDDPERYEDLYLPVVSPRGDLSLNALWAAREGPYSVERVPEIDDGTEAEVKRLIDELGTEHFAAFKDVTITDSEWAAATESGPADPLGGVVNSAVDPSPASYSPSGATVGLVFLALGTLALAWVRDRR